MDKDKVLKELVQLIGQNRAEIIEQNKLDLSLGGDLDATLIDRLKVDSSKVDGMIASIEDVLNIDDPIGQILTEFQHPNGMSVTNKVVPFGNILIIYESRPDVTIEAAISAFKAGNRIYLKGGKEAKNSNMHLVKLWHQALEIHGMPTDLVTYLDIDRTATQSLIKNNPYDIDVIIPRGGEGLINFIQSNTSIPLIVSGRGNNFAYIHDDADFEMALNIILNGKTRLSVCNALDKVLINRNLPNLSERLSLITKSLQGMSMTVHVPEKLSNIGSDLKIVEGKEIYYKEFLSPDILIDTVDSCDKAISAINKYSGGHTAVIVTKNSDVATEFQDRVDCASVIHNASSRFTDGGQFGFGAEIAISTQKLHFRGPIGLSQLVTNKWFVNGNGQIRE